MMGVRLGQFDGFIAELLNLQGANYDGVLPFEQQFDLEEFGAGEIGEDIMANLPQEAQQH